MMKFLFVALFIVAGCVSEENTITTNGKEVRNYEPEPMNDTIIARVKAMCNALSYKQDRLSVLVSTEYTFGYSQKGCSSKSSSAPLKDVRVTIAKSGSDYSFKALNGETFGFTDVETNTTGMMKEVCENVDNGLTSPMQTSSTGALWLNIYTTKEDCVSDADAFCIQVSRGSVIDGSRYAIHTNEWMKVKISGSNRGFFTERKVASTANCGDGQYLVRSAVLR